MLSEEPSGSVPAPSASARPRKGPCWGYLVAGQHHGHQLMLGPKGLPVPSRKPGLHSSIYASPQSLSEHTPLSVVSNAVQLAPVPRTSMHFQTLGVAANASLTPSPWVHTFGITPAAGATAPACTGRSPPWSTRAHASAQPSRIGRGCAGQARHAGAGAAGPGHPPAGLGCCQVGQRANRTSLWRSAGPGGYGQGAALPQALRTGLRV